MMKNTLIVFGIWALFFLYHFLFIHSFTDGCAEYQLNKSAYKKRVKGQNFFEWLLFLRLKSEIPKSVLAYYYVALAYQISTLAIMYIIYHFTNLRILCYASLCKFQIDTLVKGIIFLMFRGKGGKFDYSRRIDKKRGIK